MSVVFDDGNIKGFLCWFSSKTEQCTFVRSLLLNASAEYNELVLSVLNLLYCVHDVITESNTIIISIYGLVLRHLRKKLKKSMKHKSENASEKSQSVFE
jgi:hypothetical protein